MRELDRGRDRRCVTKRLLENKQDSNRRPPSFAKASADANALA
jgi:hypothetical protein